MGFWSRRGKDGIVDMGSQEKKTGIRLIMVDLDGTLADTEEANWLAYKEALNEYGHDISYETYCEFCDGKSYRDFLPKILGDDERLTEEVHRIKNSCYPEKLSSAKLNQPLVELLEIAKSFGCRVALVTTAAKENVSSFLGLFKMDEFFDLVITGDDVANGKPSPDCYVMARNHFGVKPEEAIIFEDSKAGLEAARASGSDTYVYHSSKGSESPC